MADIKIGAQGQVQEPCFHDGYLTGIRLEEKTTHLSLETLSGEAYKLTLSDVQEFVANHVLEGNIIFDLWILSGTKLEDDHNFGPLLSPPPRELRQHG